MNGKKCVYFNNLSRCDIKVTVRQRYGAFTTVFLGVLNDLRQFVMVPLTNFGFIDNMYIRVIVLFGSTVIFVGVLMMYSVI